MMFWHFWNFGQHVLTFWSSYWAIPDGKRSDYKCPLGVFPYTLQYIYWTKVAISMCLILRCFFCNFVDLRLMLTGFEGAILAQLKSIRIAFLNASFVTGLYIRTSTQRKPRSMQRNVQLSGFTRTRSHKGSKSWNLSNHNNSTAFLVLENALYL